jgi:hypothetical protein
MVALRRFLGLVLIALAAGAHAQPVKTQTEGLADDAAQYAAHYGVTGDEAFRRLAAQQASVAVSYAYAQ